MGHHLSEDPVTDYERICNTLQREQRGLALDELSNMVELNQIRVRKFLLRAIADGSVHQHGTGKHARYAVEPSMARRASLLAQGKDPGKDQSKEPT
jgi:hypothetical protein